MSANDDVRERIIGSVFSRRNAAGDTVENYISHVKVWEDSGNDADGLKPRFILLSRMSSRNAFASAWAHRYQRISLATPLYTNRS